MSIKAKVTFVKIQPQGFFINNRFLKSINFKIQGHMPARKKWEFVDGKKILLCTSWNGKIASYGKKCNLCPEIDECQLKHRIFFFRGETKYCLELPETSYENFRLYMQQLYDYGVSLNNVFTIVETVDRGYWGEVCFRLDSSDEDPAAIRN